jgi:diguanylate cyclase (GGDEF)-like protein
MKPVSMTSADVCVGPFDAADFEEQFASPHETSAEPKTAVIPPQRLTRMPALLVPEDDGPLDALTQLSSRTRFLSRLARSIAPTWCVEGLFVLLFDLDGFHDVNERFGYEAADRLLIELAARFKARLRPNDLVARFGPDAFALLMGGIRSGEDATRVAERLRAELARPFVWQGQEMTTTASVGIAMGTSGARPEHVIRDAERALARARLVGPAGGPIVSEGDVRGDSLQSLETALRRVLEQEEFRARYRPTVLRKEGSVPGFEIVLFRRGQTAAARRAS